MAEKPEDNLDDGLLDDDEEIDLEALLADDTDDDSVAVEEIADELDLSAPEPMAEESASDAGAAAAAAAASPKGKKGPKGKKATPKKEKKAKAAKPAKAPRKKAAPPPRVTGRAYAFVCSECYDEYLLPASYSDETVTCPECLHVGKKPDDNFLRTVAMHKAAEQRTTFGVMLCGLLMLLSVFGLIWINTAAGSSLVSSSSHQTVSYGLMGASGLLAVIFFWLLSRFEANRWEVYF
jgi:hypothetical protein